ncbi:MAG TPA: hydroxyacid dehydrogenase [Candidatus Sulfotelmatobacter sp.]|nr:hydroxyacid dehydrogenase [Candidatus Sulfotelmatobacter sp.]
MKIAFFEVQSWEEPYLKKAFKDHDLKLFKDVLIGERIGEVKDYEVISVFIYSRLTAEILSKLEALRLVATRSTGFDHIDLETCNKRGIVVCNVPTYSEDTVAEHTFALLLSLSRSIHDSYERTRQGDFSCEGISAFDLKGKTLGVLGTGRIGRSVIQIAKGFGMNVLAYDKYPNATAASTLGFQYTDSIDLLERSDMVTLHLPLNEETYHFLNKERIGRMKKGAVVINTARGALIDTEALTQALLKGDLAAAGLDVLEEETLVREEAQLLLDNVPRERLATLLRAHILLRLKNVIITPHCGFNSKESLERLINTTIENINSYMSGKPQNVV